MKTTALTPTALAKRWGVSPGTLANWRVKGKGPKYVKNFSKVFYKWTDVRTYEKRNKIVVTN